MEEAIVSASVLDSKVVYDQCNFVDIPLRVLRSAAVEPLFRMILLFVFLTETAEKIYKC